MGKKRKGLVNGIKGNVRRKARNSARQTAYIAVWHSEPPKKYKLV